MKFSGKVGNGPMNKLLHFGVTRITDLHPNTDRDTGKRCLGGGMHCHSASSYFFRALIFESEERRPAGPLPGCRNVV